MKKKQFKPTFEEISIVGCKGLKTYCLHNNLPYDRMIKHLDKGKITTTSSMGPANVKNCINYEIREIKNVKF